MNIPAGPYSHSLTLPPAVPPVYTITVIRRTPWWIRPLLILAGRPWKTTTTVNEAKCTGFVIHPDESVTVEFRTENVAGAEQPAQSFDLTDFLRTT